MNKLDLKQLIKEELRKIIIEGEDPNETKDQEMVSGGEDALYKNVWKKLLDFKAPSKHIGRMESAKWKDLPQDLLNKAFKGMNLTQKIKDLKDNAPEYAERKEMNFGFDGLLDTYIAIEINKELWG